MKKLLVLLFSFIVLASTAQDNVYLKEIEEYRTEKNAEFLDPNSSPLSAEQLKTFKGHDFFPVNEEYRVKARFEATPNSRPFSLPTTTGTTKLYRRIGILNFELEGQKLTLEAYLQVTSFAMRSSVEYVFLPVVDQTSGDTTYGVGRYLHFEGIPEGDEWIIDFNKLYNPLCAYSEDYVCPVVPKPNHLPIAINAGVKNYSPNNK